MAVRDDFTAGEVLAAADLNDTFASKPPITYGTATPSTTVEGFIWYDENSTPPAPKFWDGSAFQGIGGGKVLQVVNATYGTQTSTTSASYVDTGLTATITPSSTSSKVLIAVNQSGAFKVVAAYMLLQLVRTSTSIIEFETYLMNTGNVNQTSIGSASTSYLDSPATTSAVTYKTQFKSSSSGQQVTIQVNSGVSTITLMEIAA